MVDTKFAYIIVEGQHDIGFIGKILTFFQLKKIENFDDLNEFWRKIIPNKFPHGGNLLKRVPIPIFLQDIDMNYSIAIQDAKGETNISELLNTNLENDSLDLSKLSAIGIFMDSDKNTPEEKFKKLIKELSNF